MRYGKCLNCYFFNRSMGYCSKRDQDARPNGGCQLHMTRHEAEKEAYNREVEDDENND